MRKFLFFILFGVILYSTFASFSVVAQGGGGGGSVATPKDDLVDIRANLVFPHKVNDTLSVLCLVGNFSAQHNGAVITADSAVRYNDERLECFGDVLINKNTTYAYADRAEYDGARNLASLYSPLVKVIDQDITMYTYNFTFNTLNNVGRYWGGGVTIKAAEDETTEDDVMESRRGYYYADTKQVVGVEAVELRGEGYLMDGDSVIYNMDTERAYFFDNTNIWSDEDDYVYGDLGEYDKAENCYTINRSGYMLTKEQEVWSDSLEYYRDREMAILRSNIQIDDTTHKSIAFSDFAQYWGDEERVLLSRKPTLLNYDREQGDSLFMSADTILLLSYAMGTGPVVELSNKVSERDAAMAELMGASQDETVEEAETVEEEHEDHEDHDHSHDHEIIEADTAAVEAIEEQIERAPTAKELKRIAREERQAEKLRAEEAREYRKLLDRRDKLEQKIEERRAKGRSIYSDSLVMLRIIKELSSNSLDTIYNDDLDADVIDGDSLVMVIEADSVAKTPDSLYRVVKAYRGVSTYRNDFQMVCDSMVTISYDTTMRLYIAPVLWSDNNQISSEQMDFYTRDGDLDYADFIGKPIMVSQILPYDEEHFNQVSGKEMTAFFENNSVYRNDVDGNVQTIYFMQDDNTREVNTYSYIESGSASYFIKDRQLDGVIYRTNPTYVFAPLDLIPPDNSLYLPDYGWYASLRPTRRTVFDRTIRQSIREEKRMLERPTFKILDDINAKRKSLERSGEWRERSESVSEDATAWMKSLGFTPGEPRPEGSLEF